MAEFIYVVSVKTDTPDQADAVIEELTGYDYIETDLPRFTYEVSFERAYMPPEFARQKGY